MSKCLVTRKMKPKIEQQNAIQFYFKLGKSVAEIIKILSAKYGKDTLSTKQIHRWYRAFKNDREESEHRVGRPLCLSKTDRIVYRVKSILRRDRRLTVRMIAKTLGLSNDYVHRIVTEKLGMRNICSKLVPKKLSNNKRNHRLSISQEMLDRLRTEPNFMRRVIISDETWVFKFDPETKRHGTEHSTATSSQLEESHMNRSRMKLMLIVFFDCRGVIHQEFTWQGRVANKPLYVELLKYLKGRISHQRPDIADSWILHHDESHPSLTSPLVKEFLEKEKISVLSHPSYSPDMAPCDFFLFPKIEIKLKDCHYDTVRNVEMAVTEILDDLTEEDFQHCYQEWQKRWERCVRSEGRYFEDKIETNLCKDIEETERDSFVDHLDEMNNKRKTMEEDSRTQGFKRGLEADKILGSADDNGELMYLIQWKGTEAVDMVSAREANVKCPQIVIQFYEDRITWNKAKVKA